VRFSAREIQNNARAGWENRSYFAVFQYIAQLLRSITRVLQPLREYYGHCASIAAIALALRPVAQ